MPYVAPSPSPMFQQLSGTLNLLWMMIGVLFVVKILQNEDLIWLVKRFSRKRRDTPSSKPRGTPSERLYRENDCEDPHSEYDFRLYPKRYFFSLAEKEFFAQLELIANEYGLLAFPKVRVADIVRDAPTAAPYQFERYGKMHVDFILVSRKDFRIFAGIELDGDSHASAKQQERDRKKEAIFNYVDIPLLRLQNSDDSKEVKVHKLIKYALGNP